MENKEVVLKKKPMVFVGARVQFISTTGDLFSGTTPPEEGKNILNQIFAKSEGFSIKPKRPKGRQISIYFDPVCSSDGLLLRGARIGKSKKMMLQVLQNKHLVEEEISTCPFVVMLWDNGNQVMLIQQKSTVFADTTIPIELIMLHLNSMLSAKGLIAKWELIKEKGTFWRAIETFENIYFLRIELIAPNFFGSTHNKAEEFIKLLRQETNGTEFSIGIANEEGNVKLSQKDKLIISIASQIDEGGGNLRVTGVKKGEKLKKRLNLKKQFKYITVDEKFNDVKYLSSQNITEITDEVRAQYKSKDSEGKNEKGT